MALISIIVTCYNKSEYIKETIASVLEQTFTDWELLIIDDASIDNSVNKISEFEDKRIKLIVNECNKGANYSRNLGLNMAVSEYVIFLDGDDLLSNTCLDNRWKVVQKNKGFDLYVFDMGVFNDTVGDDKRIWSPRTKDPLKDFLAHKLPWTIMQPLWHKKLLLNINGFDEKFSRLQDVELSTRALMQKGVKFKIINGCPDCYYRVKQNRIASIYQLMEKWVTSCNTYCGKFALLLSGTPYYKYLFGTIARTHLQLIHYFKVNKITHDELIFLEKKLYNDAPSLNSLQRVVVKVIRFFNLKGLNIPGFNYFGVSLLIRLA